MQRDCLLFSTQVLVWLLPLAVVAGCHHESTVIQGDSQPEEPPYRLENETLLAVRPDLINHLRFDKAITSDLAGQAIGVGHLTFPPGSSTAIRAPFEGLVEAVYVESGQYVKKGDVLASIRSPKLATTRSEIVRLSSDLEMETQSFKRANEATAGAIAERQLLERKAKVASLRAQRDGLLQSLDALQIPATGESLLELRAPREGEVIVRKLDPGELAESPENIPAFVVADTRKLVVRASFPERDAPLLQRGLTCRVYVRSVAESYFPATIYSLVQAIEPATRTVCAICMFDEYDPRLRAEMLASVSVDLKGHTRLLVPRSAVLMQGDRRVVMVHKSEFLLERRSVVIGAQVDDRVEVVSGVAEGEELVVEGAVLLDGELDRLL